MEEVADAPGRAVLFEVELLETVHLRVRFVNERVRLQQRRKREIEREKKKRKEKKKTSVVERDRVQFEEKNGRERLNYFRVRFEEECGAWEKVNYLSQCKDRPEGIQKREIGGLALITTSSSRKNMPCFQGMLYCCAWVLLFNNKYIK